MPIPSTGPCSLQTISTEFPGNTNPLSLSDYYAGGLYVAPGTVGNLGPIPTSGSISIDHFRGSSNIPDITFDSVVVAAFRVTVPDGDDAFGYATPPADGDYGSMTPNVGIGITVEALEGIRLSPFVGFFPFSITESTTEKPNDDSTWSTFTITGTFLDGTNPRTITYTRSLAGIQPTPGVSNTWIFTASTEDLMIAGNSYNVTVNRII